MSDLHTEPPLSPSAPVGATPCKSGQALARRDQGGEELDLPPGSLPDPLAVQAAAFARAAKAPSTLRAYAADWRHFVGWCEDRGVGALPSTPETVALYLTSLAATHQPATITRRLTALTKAHQAKGMKSPATVSALPVGETLKGIRRTLGTAQKGKAPLLTADLLQVLAHLLPDLAGTRDRALLLVGYAGAFRRSELAALDLEHVAWVDEGAILTLARSKTDQEGQGRQVALPRGAHTQTCPVQALRKWIESAQISGGPLFRPVDRHGKLRGGRLHADAVGAIVQRALGRAGFEAGRYGGHSLRAGFATQAAKNGATAFDIMRQTRPSLYTDRIPLRPGSAVVSRCSGQQVRAIVSHAEIVTKVLNNLFDGCVPAPMINFVPPAKLICTLSHFFAEYHGALCISPFRIRFVSLLRCLLVWTAWTLIFNRP